MVSRCALYLATPQGSSWPTTARTSAGDRERRRSPWRPRAAPSMPFGDRRLVAELPRAPPRRLELGRMALVVPWHGIVSKGSWRWESGQQGAVLGRGPATSAQTLARQALAALENARPPGAAEKAASGPRAADRPEIQQSLSRRSAPRSPASRWRRRAAPASRSAGLLRLSLGGGRSGLVIADVSGKGTPASILMARCTPRSGLCGHRPAGQLLERLNVLFASTQPTVTERCSTRSSIPSRGGSLSQRRHVPPYHVARDGSG